MAASVTLGQDSLRRAVLAAGIDVEPRWVDETGSTNTDALRLAKDGAPEWTVVAAGHQTGGRGRLGRDWNDVPGTSLLFSVVLRPTLPPDRAPLISLLAASVMVDASGLPGMRSKWPNDLIVGERKMGGILAEGALSGGGTQHVVLGIGLNVVRSGLPGDAGSTSLLDEGGDPDIPRILRVFLLDFRLGYVDPSFPAGVVDRYASVCSTLGKRVRVAVTGERVVEGLAAALDQDGALLVDTDAGRERVGFGQVTHLGTTA